jgi:MoaA/NifB/PqqE/SkfB family radical SAM enzyme
MRQYTKEILKNVIPERILEFRRKYNAKKKCLHGPQRRDLLKFELHLADHCNFSCKNCSHFSPLAKERFLDVAIFHQDCQRIADLSFGRLEGIRFMGGEPLLHENIIDIITIARKYFPKAAFDIVTNGILLPKQAKEFWETCRRNNIQIHISKYPIKIDVNQINNLAIQHNVKIVYLNAKTEFKWSDMKLDINGAQDIEESFRLCPLSNVCIHLYEGKLYTCSTIPYIKYLNNYFGENFQIAENDYIDIYRAKNMDEILDFLCKPVPFCRYCNIKKQGKTEWGISKKERGEWIDSQ